MGALKKRGAGTLLPTMIILIIICLNAGCTYSAGDIPLFSLFDILYLARDSLLKHLCCYFLPFLGWLQASLLCVQE